MNTAPDFGSQETPFNTLGALDRFLGQVRRRITSDSFSLPPLSPIERYAVLARQRSTQTMSTLKQVIKCDPAMTALVVRKQAEVHEISAQSKSQSLDATMDKLNTDDLVAIVEQTSQNPFFKKYGDVCRHHLRKIWTNTLFTAFASEKLAEWTGVTTPHSAYLAALVHNIAEPLLISMLTEVLYADPFAIENTGDIIELVQQNHAELGADVLERMGFSQSLCNFVRHHETHVDTPVAKIVTIAYNEALQYGYSYPMASPKAALVKQSREALGLDQSVIDSLPEIIGSNLNRALSISRSF